MVNGIEGTEAIIQYKFTNSTLLWEALQCSGNRELLIAGRQLIEGNKRLAILGDAVLELILAERWYHTNKPAGNVLHKRQSLLGTDCGQISYLG